MRPSPLPRAALLVLLISLAFLSACGDTAKQQQADARAAQLEADNARLATELESARAARAQADTTLSTLTKQVSDFGARITDMTAQLDSARTLATEAQARFEQAAKSVEDAQAELTALRSDLAKSVSDANAAAERCARETANLRKQVSDLTTRLAEAGRHLNPGSLRDLLPGSTPPAPAAPIGPTGR